MANKIEMSALQKTIEALEIRSAYQEDMIEHLNNALGQQQFEIQQLKKQMVLVSDMFRQFKNDMGDMGAGIKHPSEEVPPPHY
mgnify:CR=1 FL=1